jgi:hypothetical protein
MEKMKILKIISILTIAVFLFNACEKIDAPYKEDGGSSGGEAVQKVLVEDYTGHECVNCPGAAVVAEQMKDLYGDRIVVMAVHAGFFARPTGDMPQDFRTDAGEAWDTYFGISAAGNPNGMINRVERAPGDHIVNVGEWRTQAGIEMENEAKIKMDIQNNFGQNTLTSKVSIEFLFPMDGKYNLLFCITQDSLVGPQKNNDDNVGDTPLIENYVFNHVLRYTNGVWGEQISDNESFSIGDKFDLNYTVNFENDWVPKHCHVVAFVFDQQTKTIVQVEEGDVTE